jgi:hypothetical protein
VFSREIEKAIGSVAIALRAVIRGRATGASPEPMNTERAEMASAAVASPERPVGMGSGFIAARAAPE